MDSGQEVALWNQWAARMLNSGFDCLPNTRRRQVAPVDTSPLCCPLLRISLRKNGSNKRYPSKPIFPSQSRASVHIDRRSRRSKVRISIYRERCRSATCLHAAQRCTTDKSKQEYTFPKEENKTSQLRRMYPPQVHPSERWPLVAVLT